MGRPKALVELDGEPLVLRAVRVLRDGGCAPIVVVLGAAADEVLALLPADVHVVVEPGWTEGMGASLRAGLSALSRWEPAPQAALVHLVDLPGVTAVAVARLARLSAPDLLARAAYEGHVAHPVLIGRSHWTAVSARAVGDSAARGYLADNPAVTLVECGDIASPQDVDTLDELSEMQKRLGRSISSARTRQDGRTPLA
jgi:CTP:molybdopterin cytidylyltransferase MocA